MLSVPSNVRLLIAAQPVDFRKSFDGLAAVVEHCLKRSPTSGDVFVFLNKRANQVRLLYWDGDGFCLVAKRLELGTFRRHCNAEGKHTHAEVGRAELTLILDGIDVSSLRKRKRYKQQERNTN